VKFVRAFCIMLKAGISSKLGLQVMVNWYGKCGTWMVILLSLMIKYICIYVYTCPFRFVLSVSSSLSINRYPMAMCLYSESL